MSCKKTQPSNKQRLQKNSAGAHGDAKIDKILAIT